MKPFDTSKWQWMMDYCKEHSIPPAQSWAWGQAEEAYIKSISSEV